MSDARENIFSPHLSGFRKHHSSQSVIVNLIENCNFALDNSNMYRAVLTDLSKVPYQLVNKFDAYGFNHDSCMLIASYLQGGNNVLDLPVIKVSG